MEEDAGADLALHAQQAQHVQHAQRPPLFVEDAGDAEFHQEPSPQHAQRAQHAQQASGLITTGAGAAAPRAGSKAVRWVRGSAGLRLISQFDADTRDFSVS